MIEDFHKSIEGWCDFEPLYKRMVDTHDTGIFVEVGCWKGQSAAYMAMEILNQKKDIDFFCVDTWLGSDEHQGDKDVMSGTLFSVFLSNMKKVKGGFIPIQKESVEASKDFLDESVDFIYLDASHDYDNVKKDLLVWLPKIKQGGIIGGHDYGMQGVVDSVTEILPDHILEFNSTWTWTKPMHLF